MTRIPMVSWKPEVLEMKAELCAQRLQGDARAADLAPALEGAAGTLKGAAEEALQAKVRERVMRMALVDAEGTVQQAVRKARAVVLAAADGDPARAPYRMAFPEGTRGMLNARRETMADRVQGLAEALAAMPGMEAQGKAVADAGEAARKALAEWRQAKGTLRKTVITKQAAKEALVEEFRLAWAAVRVRLRDKAQAEALFPDLAPTAKDAKGTGTEAAPTGAATEARKDDAKPPVTVAA